MNLPDEIGDFIGVPETVSEAEKTILPPDTVFAKRTYGPLGAEGINRINCQIVLSGKEKRSIHRPERCLPGQGWSVLSSQLVDIPLISGHPLKVTALLLSRPVTLNDGTSKSLESYYLYWYIGRDVATPFSFERVMLTNWDLVVHRENQRWAYVIYQGFVTQGFAGTEGLTPEQTLDNLKKFIRASTPYFVKSEMNPKSTASVFAPPSPAALTTAARGRQGKGLAYFIRASQ